MLEEGVRHPATLPLTSPALTKQIMRSLDYHDDATGHKKICGSGGANVVGLNRCSARANESSVRSNEKCKFVHREVA